MAERNGILSLPSRYHACMNCGYVFRKEHIGMIKPFGNCTDINVYGYSLVTLKNSDVEHRDLFSAHGFVASCPYCPAPA
jgi:hypothetical protein